MQKRGIETGMNNMQIFTFSREEVIHQDFTFFLSKFDVDNLPEGHSLSELENSLVFLIAGFDDCEEEIYQIREIRDFYQKLNEVWPYWLYFLNIENHAVQLMAACLVDTSVEALVGSDAIGYSMDPLQVAKCLKNGWAPMNQLFEQVGASEMANYNRTRNICLNLKMPFDGPPLEEDENPAQTTGAQPITDADKFIPDFGMKLAQGGFGKKKKVYFSDLTIETIVIVEEGLFTTMGEHSCDDVDYAVSFDFDRNVLIDILRKMEPLMRESFLKRCEGIPPVVATLPEPVTLKIVECHLGDVQQAEREAFVPFVISRVE